MLHVDGGQLEEGRGSSSRQTSGLRTMTHWERQDICQLKNVACNNRLHPHRCGHRILAAGGGTYRRSQRQK